jgi:uncharacterized metal-binding protein
MRRVAKFASEEQETMPGHKTHDTNGIAAIGALVPASYAVLHLGLGDAPAAAYSGMLVVVGSHVWATWMLSPDLDIDSAIYDRWGPLRWLWWPYQKVIPHRSWFSHSGVSGVLRLAYLALALWLLLAALAWAGQSGLGLNSVPDYHTWFWDWLTRSVQASGTRPALLIVAGVVIADLLHVGADIVTSEIKGFWKQVWR